jgi:hypothetical protein
MKRSVVFILGLLLALPAQAQNFGLIPSGQVIGNSGASSALGKKTTVTSLLDRAICSNPQAYIVRWAAGWVCTQVTFDNRDNAVNTTIPVGPKWVRLNGYSNFLDGVEDALYA